jgi:hypothetical protein
LLGSRTTVRKHFGNRLEAVRRGAVVLSGDLTKTIEHTRGVTIRQLGVSESPGLLSAAWSDVERRRAVACAI